MSDNRFAGRIRLLADALQTLGPIEPVSAPIKETSVSIIDRLRNEPVLVTTLVGALLVLLVQAGLPISDGLSNAISGVVVAVLAIVARQHVSPSE